MSNVLSQKLTPEYVEANRTLIESADEIARLRGIMEKWAPAPAVTLDFMRLCDSHEALRAEVARLKVQQMQFRGWLDHACSLIGGEEASYVIGVVDKLGFASPFDSTENAALLRDTDRPSGEGQ